jgi:hypothetical protein
VIFANARIIALVICAGLVGPVSLADAQIALVNQKLEAFRDASLGRQSPLPPSPTRPSRIGGVLGQIETQEPLVLRLSFLRNALSNPDGGEAGNKKFFAQQLADAIQQRDAAATALAEAIDATMRTMNPNNEQDGRRLDQVFDEIEAINKTTTDALLGYDETLAILQERAVAEQQAGR